MVGGCGFLVIYFFQIPLELMGNVSKRQILIKNMLHIRLVEGIKSSTTGVFIPLHFIKAMRTDGRIIFTDCLLFVFRRFLFLFFPPFWGYF
jgi:hypothetical protein